VTAAAERAVRPEQGFSLIEIMVALTILAITLGGFAALSFYYIKRVEVGSATTQKTAELNEQAQRLSALSFDSLDSRAGCTTFSSGVFPHTRCITVTNVGGNARHKRVTIVITPANTLVKPDTVIMDRTKTPTTNPYNI
jgi:prepilin-type N-terminal cleavage/methylation domain-containing protein